MHPSISTPLLTSALRIAAGVLFLAMVTGLYVGGAQPVAVDLFPWPWGKLVHSITFGVLAVAVGVASGRCGTGMMLAGFWAAWQSEPWTNGTKPICQGAMAKSVMSALTLLAQR